MTAIDLTGAAEVLDGLQQNEGHTWIRDQRAPDFPLFQFFVNSFHGQEFS